MTPAEAPTAPAAPPPKGDPVLWAQAGVCTGGGVCWDHPLPQGNTLLAAARPSAAQIVAVGALGTTLVFSTEAATTPGWSSPQNQSRQDLSAVYSTGSGTTWAAGAAGTLLSLDAAQASWTQAAIGTAADLRGLAGTGEKDVWAVGDGGTVLHYDGAAWTQVAVPTMADLYAVFARQGPAGATAAAGQSEVFIVGSGGTVLHRDGALGAPFTASAPAGTASDLLAVTGAVAADGASAPDEVWAAGSGGLLARCSGGTWAQVSSPTTSSIVALTAVGPELWASTAATELWHYSALSQWAKDSMPSGEAYNYVLRGLAGPDREHLLAVGDLGEMLAYDGQAWSELSRRQTALGLTGLWGPGDGSLWAVGDGAALRYAGGAWQAVQVPDGAGLSAVWGADGTVYAVGALALRYDGQQFVQIPAAQGVLPLYGMWGVTAQDAWAVGQDLYHYDGNNFTQFQGADLRALEAIGGSGPADIWAAGQGGTVQHYDGQGWQPLATGQDPTVTLTGVWPVGPGDAWVVGTADAILHYDGQRFTSEGAEASSGASWTQVWARDAGEVWVVGRGGAVKRYYQGAWSVVQTPTAGTLEAVYGVPGGDVVLAGQDGTILRYRP